MQPVGGKIMKNKAMAKKFRTRIGIVLFMVLIMLAGSCLSELRYSALAMDTAGEALAEMGQGDASESSKSMPQPEPVVMLEQQDKTRVESETPESETAPEGAEGEGPAAVDVGEEANPEEVTSETETPEPATAPEESNDEVNNLEMDAAASAMATALQSAVSTPDRASVLHGFSGRSSKQSSTPRIRYSVPWASFRSTPWPCTVSTSPPKIRLSTAPAQSLMAPDTVPGIRELPQINATVSTTSRVILRFQLALHVIAFPPVLRLILLYMTGTQKYILIFPQNFFRAKHKLTSHASFGSCICAPFLLQSN